MPNAPPTSSVMTRSFSFGMFITRPSLSRMAPRALRADAQVIAVARRVVARGRAARLHRGVRQPLLRDSDTRDVLGGGDDALDLGGVGLGIGMRAGPVEREIARRFRPQLRRAVSLRRLDRDHRIERLVVDLDQIGGVLRRERGLGDHHRDRLADIHRRARAPARGGAASTSLPPSRPGSGGWRVTLPWKSFRSSPVSTATTPLIALAALGVDRLDVGGGVGRADEHRIGLAGQGRVGHVAAKSPQELVVFDPGRALMGGLGVHVG